MKQQALARRGDPFRVIAWAIVAITTAALLWLAILTHRDNSTAAEAAEEAVKLEDVRVARYTREWKALQSDRRLEAEFRREERFHAVQQMKLQEANELRDARRRLENDKAELKDSQDRLMRTARD